MTLRDISKMKGPNDGTRTLFESVMAPEVIAALRDWIACVPDGVIVGGVALSYYEKPRMTQDVDVLFVAEADVPQQVQGFKRTRAHAYLHLATHVEMEVLTPEYLGVSKSLVMKVCETARRDGDALVASPSGLVAMKLCSMRPIDRADIVNLILNQEIDVSGFDLTQEQLAKFVALQEEAAEEKRRPALGD